jgi:hypothetical protein
MKPFVVALFLLFLSVPSFALLSIRGPLQLLFHRRAARQVAQTTALSSFRRMVATMALSLVR